MERVPHGVRHRRSRIHKEWDTCGVGRIMWNTNGDRKIRGSRILIGIEKHREKDTDAEKNIRSGIKCRISRLQVIHIFYPFVSLLYDATKVFSLNLGRKFACEVGLRPNSTYACAALEKYLFCHSNSQFLSFAFLIFLLALLRDWTWSCSVARGTFALFLVS